ncbi:hypothetical protein Tco_0972940 [Tanacetum coccineum]
MSKLLYTRFTTLIINHFLSNNNSINRRSSSKLHSSQDNQTITKLSNTVKGDYRFGIEIPDRMTSDEIKKLASYKFYMAKKVESENAKTVDEPKEQHVSPVKSGRGKRFMCFSDQVANVPNKPKKDVVPRKTRSLTIAEETVVGELAHSINIQKPRTQQRQRSQLTIDRENDEAVADMYNEWGQKLKGLAVDDPTVQSLLDLRKGSKASRLESLMQMKQADVEQGSSTTHNKYYDSSDTDSDAILYSSISDKTWESTNETDDADESDMDLSDDNSDGDDDDAWYGVFMHTKSTVTPNSTYLGASEVPLSTHVDVLETKTLLQEMFPDKNAHHLSSPPVTKTSYPSTYPQPSSLQAKKLEALTNFNVSEAFEKDVQAKVLTEIKKLLPTHIPNTIANYDPLNNHKGENKKKRRKDVGELSSRSSRGNKSPVIHAQDDTPTTQPLDSEDKYIWAHPNPEWYTKSGSAGAAKRKTTWFDLLLKLDINQNKNHILGPSTVAIAKKLKAIIQKDELTITDLEGAGLERLKQ